MAAGSAEHRRGEEADSHGVAAALYEGWRGRGVTGVMGGTCTGWRTMVSPKVTFLSLSTDLGLHQWLSVTEGCV